MAEVARGKNVGFVTEDVIKRLETFVLPEGIQMEIGGQYDDDKDTTPKIASALVISIAIIFFVLLWHFKNVSEALLIMICLTLCVFGTSMGILIGGVPVSMTAVLGFVSLMGILVRNGVILFDYAAEVMELEHLPLKEAIHVAAERRMRPIFLYVGCRLDGCGADGVRRFRPVVTYGMRHLLWRTHHHVLHPHHHADSLLEGDGTQRSSSSSRS